MEEINKLLSGEILTKSQWIEIIDGYDTMDLDWLFERAREKRKAYYDNHVYLRGLIEISNYCKKNCYYCGIRAGNKEVVRYRLNKEDILKCAEKSYSKGIRTIVMQGGEDITHTDEFLCEIVGELRSRYSDIAITLSLGERSRESYQKLFDSGANRYLLRHETANSSHYKKLHPTEKLEDRLVCLNDLKEIGFQVGCGFMVGSPYQTSETLAEDMMLIQQFKPHMIGIGPFLPHHSTPFRDELAGEGRKTLFMVALTRITLPMALIPATTALGTVMEDGWELGMMAGANVIMPSLTPEDNKVNYLLYDNKNGTSVDELSAIKDRMEKIDHKVVMSRGDHWEMVGEKPSK